MGRMGNFDLGGLKALKKQLEGLDKEYDEFVRYCAKQLTARLLRLVIKATPVGDYPAGTGKKGGTLRRGWTDGKQINAASFAQSMTIRKQGRTYIIVVTNPVEYAPYVEYGHRTADHKGWVSGQFMMTKSEQELARIAPSALEREIEQHLRGIMK